MKIARKVAFLAGAMLLEAGQPVDRSPLSTCILSESVL